MTAPSSCVTLLSAKGAMRSREDHERLDPLFAVPFAFLVSCVAEPFSSKAALVLACSSVQEKRLLLTSRMMVPPGSSGAIGEPESSSVRSLTAPSSCVTLSSAKDAMRSREDHERLDPLFAVPFAFLVSPVAEPFSSRAALTLVCSSSVQEARLLLTSRVTVPVGSSETTEFPFSP